MKTVYLVIPGLFLPQDFAAEVCGGLSLPALEKMLARGVSDGNPLTGSDPSTSSGRAGFVSGSGSSADSARTEVPLESLLCGLFGVPVRGDEPIAPVSAAFDGLGEGCWLRADPVHLHLDQSRMLLSPVALSGEEAAALCAGLNDHFAEQGMTFFAPHPQRWYVRTETLPRIRTVPLPQVVGCDVRGALPGGEDAVRWHGVFNEVQMLLHGHPVNAARAARGGLPVNSVWLWGGGCSGDVPLQKNYDGVSSDDVLPEILASAADVPFVPWNDRWHEAEGRQLLVWTGLRAALQRGDLAGWRAALQDFETGYAAPLWQALRAGRISRLQLDVPGSASVRLSRGDAWTFWRRARPLARYPMV